MGKLKTPDWILQGKKKPKEKNKLGKFFKVKTCPKCGSTDVSVVLSGEEGRGSQGWECKKCKWAGKNIQIKEVSEEEFLKMGEGK